MLSRKHQFHLAWMVCILYYYYSSCKKVVIEMNIKINNSYFKQEEELIVVTENMLPPALKEIGINSILLDKSAYVSGLLHEDIEKIKNAVSVLTSA